MRRSVPPIAARQCGVFAVWQALAAGWTHPALRHATLTGALTRLRVGAYQVADLSLLDPGLNSFEVARWRHAAPAVAAVLTTPGALASHSTAAVLRGMPLIFLPEQPCICVVPWHTGGVRRVHLHRCSLSPRTTPVAAVETTSTEQTVIDLAREHGMPSGLVAADFALHTNKTTRAQLLAALEACRRWPGVLSAREAIAFADERSESVLESRSRLAMREWGLQAPELQVRIGNEWGGFVARVDFYWDEFGVVGEADGAVKYPGTDPEPLVLEKKRQEAMERLDLPVVRWDNSDLRSFGAVAARLRRTFARAARAPRSERRWTVLPPR